MRYIALDENAGPAPVPQSDGSIKDAVCLNVLSALLSLQYAAEAKTDDARRRQMSHSKMYHGGRAEAYRQAVKMLRGILSGEFSSQSSTPDDICRMTEET